MLKNIGRADFYNLLTESQLETLFQREKEITSVTDDFTGYDQIYQYDEENGKVYYIINNSEGIDVYTLVFEIKNSVGRPSLGVTKKVSITLPEEIWNMIEQRKEELGVSQSQTLRMMIEGYFNNVK